MQTHQSPVTRRWLFVILVWAVGGLATLASATEVKLDETALSKAMIKASATVRPRSLGSDAEQQSLRTALLSGDRRDAFARLRERVQRFSSRALISNLPGAQKPSSDGHKDGIDKTDFARRINEELLVKNAVETETQFTQEALFLAWANNDTNLPADVHRRVIALTALDPDGITGGHGEELSACNIALTLTLALDWRSTSWTADERALIVQAIESRVDGLLAMVTQGNLSLTAVVPVSHSTEIAGALAEISVLMLGESNSAERWARAILPVYASTLSRWGGSDGGFANGTAYASWDVGAFTLRHLDTLRRAAGIDLYSKDWVRHFGRYLVYMLPPGTPRNVFGDGAERNMAEEWARYGRAYALRVADPLYAWYARQWTQQDDSRLELLAAPTGNSLNGSFPTNTPSSAYFPSIGWVGMHSDLSDPSRVSVYFKSSPYGSVSHSHADQNSFTLVSAGQPLLIDSGYYDSFGSNHHFQWNRQTLAHNAITVDGGQGQGAGDRQMGDISATGRITQYNDSGAVVLTTGDATAAYKGLLSKAVRSIAYLRSKTFVVFDSVEAPKPRTIEWNLHAMEQMKSLDQTHLEIESATERVCVDMYSDSPVAFTQRTGFTTPPNRDAKSPRPDEWHGAFSSLSPLRKLRLAAVFRVGCEPTPVAVSWSETQVTAQVGNTKFTFTGNQVQ